MGERIEASPEKLQDMEELQSESLAEEEVSDDTQPRAGADPFARIPLLNRLMENPDIQETLLAWLTQNRREQKEPVEQRQEAAGGIEFGFGHFQRREEWANSSSVEEVTRYCQQLRHRANWLEATLQGTLGELERIEQIRKAMVAGGASSDS
ncbi:MAG: hypothetical protein U1F42_10545 [Candidatus Competibacteraceae bacterium]